MPILLLLHLFQKEEAPPPPHPPNSYSIPKRRRKPIHTHSYHHQHPQDIITKTKKSSRNEKKSRSIGPCLVSPQAVLSGHEIRSIHQRKLQLLPPQAPHRTGTSGLSNSSGCSGCLPHVIIIKYNHKPKKEESKRRM